MYTQCPDCSTAFRVTAEVLKQAAGKVRCGGCGNAFNALEYLSEDMPAQSTVKDHEEPLPQLTPEPPQTDQPVARPISDEQSAELLKTLDELAGADIRIEDTGVEWRVLDDKEVSQAAADDDTADVSNIDDSVLDEFLDEAPKSVEELRFDDNTPLPDDFNLDDELPDETEPPDSDPSEAKAEAESAVDHEPIDIVLSDPGEWADILDEVDEPLPDDGTPLDAEIVTVENTADEAPEDEAEEAAVESGNELDDADELLDVDTQFALQAEAMGIELSGVHRMSEDGGEDEDAKKHHTDSEEDVEEGEEQAPLLFESVDTAIAELEQQSNVFDENFFEAEESLDSEDHQEVLDVAESEEKEPLVPPPTEDEQTRDGIIDQDLLSFAVEDEDGSASTIVIQEKGAAETAVEEDQAEPVDEDRSVGFESIIMEGEFVRSALDDEKREADMAEAAQLAELARAAREAKSDDSTGERRYGMIAAIIALGVLLLVQVMHQSREALATIPAFNNVVGPVYRAIGKPLSPAWDITGWRFEATRDISDENDEHLTFYSRIGNNSSKPLPYPLISISLTDRFEETIGSRMLSPPEYLTNNLDPGKLVQPGKTFNAVISVQAPARDAMGYKLKACYRLSEGQLRCKMPDFR
jgi:predicted Zn finger-like uncharacterized protein